MDRASPWFFRGLLGLSALLALSGCASAARPAAEPQPVAGAPGGRGFLDGPARRVRSRVLEFPIEFSLPSKDTWQLTDGPSWLVATHPASESLLAVRTWRADRLVRRSECEAQARLARPSVPIVREESLLERRALSAPPDFDTELVVGVEPSAPGISGYAIAFGAGVGRCYAAVFTTRVSGPQAELEVAARLGLAVDRILSSVRLRSVDERAVRRRLISAPRPPAPPLDTRSPEER